MKKFLFVGLVLVSLLFFLGCAQPVSDNFKVSYLVEDSLAKYTVLLIFNSNSSATLDLSLADGNTFHSVSSLDSNELYEFKQLINSANVNSLSDVYECTSSCNDKLSTTVTFFIDGKEKKVLIKDLKGLPLGLAMVINEIQSLWGEKFSK